MNAWSRCIESMFFRRATQTSVVSAEGLQGGRFQDLGFEDEGCVQLTPTAGLRFFFTGPLGHFFYLLMERWIPSEVPLAGIKRLLLDRLLFAPAFLSLFFLVMNFLEVGLQHSCTLAVRWHKDALVEFRGSLNFSLKLKFHIVIYEISEAKHCRISSTCWPDVSVLGSGLSTSIVIIIPEYRLCSSLLTPFSRSYH